MKDNMSYYQMDKFNNNESKSSITLTTSSPNEYKVFEDVSYKLEKLYRNFCKTIITRNNRYISLLRKVENRNNVSDDEIAKFILGQKEIIQSIKEGKLCEVVDEYFEDRSKIVELELHIDNMMMEVDKLCDEKIRSSFRHLLIVKPKNSDRFLKH